MTSQRRKNETTSAVYHHGLAYADSGPIRIPVGENAQNPWERFNLKLRNVEQASELNFLSSSNFNPTKGAADGNTKEKTQT
jgi:hypothetical protein